MFEAEIYAGSVGRHAKLRGKLQVVGADLLTPKLAKALLLTCGLNQGYVFQENALLPDGRSGTLFYRVFESGRSRREFWEDIPEMFGLDMPF